MRGVQGGYWGTGDVNERDEVRPDGAVFLHPDKRFPGDGVDGAAGSSLRESEHCGKGRGRVGEDVLVDMKVDVVGGAYDEVADGRVEVERGVVE